MRNDTLERLHSMSSSFPMMFAKSLPTTAEVDFASAEIGIPFSTDYRDFILTFGAAMVGPHPIYGLRPVEVMGKDDWSVVVMTMRYRNDEIRSADEWSIVSTDHSGNPIGMDRDGAIWIHDHDFGGVAPLAKDFEEYIRVNCLGMNAN